MSFGSERPQKGIAIYLHSLTQGPDSEFAQAIKQDLVNKGYGVFSFTFDFFLEKSNPFIGLKSESDQLEEAIALISKEKPDQEMTLVGKSLGGSIALNYAASSKPDRLKEIIILGLPLALGYPPRVDLLKGAEPEPFNPETEYKNLLKEVDCKITLIQGGADDLGSIEGCKGILEGRENTNLVVIDGADHSFMVDGASAMEQVLVALNKD